MTVACPCCGYRTLPARGGYDLCPVCSWEDQPNVEPWEFSDANGSTLVQAQQEHLREGLRGRSPRPGEERDSTWQPVEVTDEVRALVQQSLSAEAQLRRRVGGYSEEELYDSYPLPPAITET